MDDPERSDGRRGAMSKARAITARLALILSRMRLAGDPTRPMWGDSQGVPPIEAIDVEGAIRLAAYLENHRERAVGRMTRGTGDGPADAIVEWLRAGSRETFTERELTQARRRLKDDPDALAAAMARLAKANAIRPREAAQAGPKGGRPSSAVYDVNPALLVTQNPQNPRNP
jgi:hypothetical protein